VIVGMARRYRHGVRRPAIGIPAPVEQAAYGAWDSVCAVLPMSYAHAIQRAGGIAVVLVPDEATTGDPDEVLDRVDGLVLAGGRDLDPGAYGAAAHPQTSPPDPLRDAFELALTTRALARDLPVLGICRGMQVLNVARGGTLHQHLPDLVGHEEHRLVQGTFGDHDVRLEDGSLAARAAGGPLVATKSHHHQGVDRVGDGLRVTGWSAPDGSIEAIEADGERFALGVQWHPEADEASVLIAALVAEARSRLRPT
jgi:putative glutamine amidotransferase